MQQSMSVSGSGGKGWKDDEDENKKPYAGVAESSKAIFGNAAFGVPPEDDDDDSEEVRTLLRRIDAIAEPRTKLAAIKVIIERFPESTLVYKFLHAMSNKGEGIVSQGCRMLVEKLDKLDKV